MVYLLLHRSLSLIYILGIMHSMQIRRSYAYSSMGHWHVKIFLQNDAYHWITYKHKVNADPAHKAIRWLLRESFVYVLEPGTKHYKKTEMDHDVISFHIGFLAGCIRFGHYITYCCSWYDTTILW